MKKILFKRLVITIIIGSIALLGANYLLQLELARGHMEKKALIKLNQIEEILAANEEEIALIREELGEDYIVRAKAVAYMLTHHPEHEHNLTELKKMAELFQVDELHLFNQFGILYSGTIPKYYGMTMRDGEQIQFFLPMLKDTSMEMVQNLMANTAEGKQMKYVAVWREDGKGIVQIGILPERLMEAMDQNEISYIFSKVLLENDTVLYAVNKESNLVEGCSKKSLIGQKAQEIGLNIPDDITEEYGFFLKIEGRDHYCIFKEIDGRYIGISQEKSQMYETVQRSMKLLAVYLIVIVVIMIIAIMVQLDKLIIQGIQRINMRLSEITRGNLDVVVEERSVKEFSVLSDNINLMVNSILDNTNMLSRLFDKVDVEIGIYEYYRHMKRVLVTGKTTDLLGVAEDEKHEILSDKERFEGVLSEAKLHPVEGTKDVYLINDGEKRYIRMKSFENAGVTYGVLVDETDDVLEKQRIEHERDSDMLTGLYSRRAFFNKAKLLFGKPEVLKNAVILMADVDYLKTANDTYGHGFGDRLIASASELFKNSPMPNTIAVRLSGDEFALLIYGAETKAELEQEIKRIYQSMINKTIKTPDGADYPVRLSAGYVFYPQQVQNFDELMHYADNAMYRVKRKNKANFMEYDREKDSEKEE